MNEIVRHTPEKTPDTMAELGGRGKTLADEEVPGNIGFMRSWVFAEVR
jgi:hypothetical protein